MPSAVQISVARRLILGFVAGALAVVIFHQLTSYVLGLAGLSEGQVYSLRGVPPFGVPRILSQMFWGGMWGVLFALIYDRFLPERPAWIGGFVYGLLGPLLVGWTLVAFIRGAPLFGGLNPSRMLVSFLLNAVAFGIGLALIYRGLRRLAAGSAHGLPA